MNDKTNNVGGLLDTNGMIDSLIADCNDLVKQVVSGNYLVFCAKVVEAVQKLTKLKEGVANEKNLLQSEIAELKRFNADLSNLVCSAEKGE